jgi:hypothetical protein
VLLGLSVLAVASLGRQRAALREARKST